VHVRSTFKPDAGTIVTREDHSMEDVVVTSITHDRGQAKLSILRVPDRPGIASQVFGGLASQNIVVDMIVQNIGRDGSTDISFTLARADRQLEHGRVRRTQIETDAAREGRRLSGCGGRVEPPARLLRYAQRQILRYRERLDEREVLVHHADAGVARGARRGECCEPAIEQDSSGIRLIQAGEHSHECGLAGTVFAEHGMDLAGVKIEIHSVERRHGTEPFRNGTHR